MQDRLGGNVSSAWKSQILRKSECVQKIRRVQKTVYRRVFCAAENE